jgi:DNA-directed RNA polymerase specialized sigma24 family protein
MTPERRGPDEPYPDVEALIKGAGADMTRLAYGSVRSYADAEDAVQNAFIGIHRNWAVVPSEQAAGPRASAPDTARHAAARIGLGRVWCAVAGLPRARREVMSLYIAGHNYGEIAEMMGISVSAVRSHMSHARRQLRAVVPDLADGPGAGEGD